MIARRRFSIIDAGSPKFYAWAAQVSVSQWGAGQTPASRIASYTATLLGELVDKANDEGNWVGCFGHNLLLHHHAALSARLCDDKKGRFLIASSYSMASRPPSIIIHTTILNSAIPDYDAYGALHASWYTELFSIYTYFRRSATSRSYFTRSEAAWIFPGSICWSNQPTGLSCHCRWPVYDKPREGVK